MKLSRALAESNNVYIATGHPGSSQDYAFLKVASTLEKLIALVERSSCFCHQHNAPCLHCEFVTILKEAQE